MVGHNTLLRPADAGPADRALWAELERMRGRTVYTVLDAAQGSPVGAAPA